MPFRRPQISWLLIIYAENPYHLYASRLIAGVVGAGQLICITIFVTEISHDKWAKSAMAIQSAIMNFNFQNSWLIEFIIRSSIQSGHAAGLCACQLFRLCDSGEVAFDFADCFRDFICQSSWITTTSHEHTETEGPYHGLYLTELYWYKCLNF